MRKEKLFKILQDPDCDPKYIELALKLYNPDEIIKIPAICLRSLNPYFPSTDLLEYWYSLANNVPRNTQDINPNYNKSIADLGCYLRAHYTENPEVFFRNMSRIRLRTLIRKLFPKYKIMKSTPNFNGLRVKCAFNLHAHGFVSYYELRLFLRGLSVTNSLHSKLFIDSCVYYVSKLYRKPNGLSLASQRLALEVLAASDYYIERALRLCKKKMNINDHLEWEKFLTSVRSYAEHYQASETAKQALRLNLILE